MTDASFPIDWALDEFHRIAGCNGPTCVAETSPSSGGEVATADAESHAANRASPAYQSGMTAHASNNVS
jgi:hypothetical protein